jgi:hypothetical protein
MLRQACRYALANRGHDIQNGTTGDHVKALPVKIGELTSSRRWLTFLQLSAIRAFLRASKKIVALF